MITKQYPKARPTEYEGIVFRSKSEAIFARALDLRGFTWEYEPKRWLAEDGWGPDFWVVGYDQDHLIYNMLVEYKPGEATDTYLKELHGRFGDMIGVQYFHCFAVCGSSFNETRECFRWGCGGWSKCESGYDFFRHIDEASKYRFDLKHR